MIFCPTGARHIDKTFHALDFSSLIAGEFCNILNFLLR